MTNATLSEKQREIMRFPYTKYDALICDGAVRSGKSSIMSLSFFLWAMANFNGCNFALCSKSVGAAERNVVTPLLSMTYIQQNFDAKYNRAGHYIFARRGTVENRFYLFGGKDESSYSLIQGITLAGVLLDEVTLMPMSFVKQALARTSVSGAKLWFNCNPDTPMHWFRQEWLLQLEEHNAKHIHFTMDDNPSLDEKTKARFKSMFSGIFYQRYIQGLWVMGDGVIYDMFDHTENTYAPEAAPVDLHWTGVRTIAIDYGTTNPTRFLDIYDYDGTVYVDAEYSWDSKKEFRQKTDEEYAEDFMQFMGADTCAAIVDPSAASFIAALEARGVYVIKADNTVLDGIRRTGTLIQQRKIKINTRCTELIAELGAYVWDAVVAKRGEERPAKVNDHSCDALRYFVNSLPEWRFENVATQ